MRNRDVVWSRIVIAGLLVTSAAALLLKGSGVKTWAMSKVSSTYWEQLSGPEIAATYPKDGEMGVPTDATIRANLKHANRRLDPASITSTSIVLVRTRDQQPTDCDVTVDHVGALIQIKPRRRLAEKTQYTLLFASSITDNLRKPLRSLAVSFTTAGKCDPALRFNKIPLAAATGVGFTAVVMSPLKDDRTLYAASDDGRIFRFPVLPNGTLAPPQVISSLVTHENAPRVLTGFCFDPPSTKDNPILWASHSFGAFQNVPDFSGKISRISGRDLEIVQDVVINLPRSSKDHMNNQPAIGPDGALYWCQPSNTAFGDPDPIWSYRQEHLLNATVLRLDTKKWTPGHPIDARTIDAGGTYDPTAKNAPLTIHAFGVRLGYDLVWHSNGHLYVPVNGSSAGGNAPAGNGAPALKDIPLDEDDWLFKIVPGKYYGHPNPQYKRFVLNGGNPTAGYDFAEMPLLPVGTRPEPDWQRACYVFGRHVSANGVIEYKDLTFGGKLDKCLMVCRYNFGSDILVLHLDKSGNVISDDCTIAGLDGLKNPLDITEDLTNGNLYVSEYGAQRITLLRPQ